MATPNAVSLELFYSGAWNAVPLYSTTGATVTRGHDPDGSWPRPTRIDCEINNDTLAYDPARPESPLYGIAGRNTKARLIVNAGTRVWAEAAAWHPDRTVEHSPGVRGRAWVDLAAEGVLRRLGMWSDPIRSPMYRTNASRSTSIGHWPLEDDANPSALTIVNTLPNGRAGALRGGAVLGESNAPLGAEQTVKHTATSEVSGQFTTASLTGWQVSVTFRLAAIPAASTEILRWTTSAGHLWQIMADPAGYSFIVTDVSLTGSVTLLNSPWAFGAVSGVVYSSEKWITMRVRVTMGGGNYNVQGAWYVQGAPLEVGMTDGFAGTAGTPRQWWSSGSTGFTDGHLSHVFGVTGVTDDLLSWPNKAVFNGYLGESAWDRFTRLCNENGIQNYRIGTSTDTQAMGPQKTATLLDLLREIRDTDDCRIDDERFDIALTMRTRRALYNQTAALALTYPADIAPPLVRILDDLNTHNRITIKNASGGEITESQDTGPMSVLPPPSGVGEYKQTIDVNVANPDNQLQPIGDWRRARGTIERPRYGEVTIDLLADPGLAAAAAAVREGDLITITGYEPDVIPLIVVGIREKIGAIERTMTFQTEPADPYFVGVYDDGVWRWDTASTTLAAGATAVATSLSLTTANAADVLTTAAGSIPYDLLIGGERVRVTAMTAAAGTGPYTQTATVTRSINGVSKAQTAGTPVRVFDARRWGL